MSGFDKNINRNKDPEKAKSNVLKAVVRKRLIAMNKYSAEVLVDMLAKKLTNVVKWDDVRIANDEVYLKLLDETIQDVMK